MIFTIPVLLYQLLFVLILYIASRFGRTALNIAAILCAIWTATHIFFPPLMIFQGIVIGATYLYFGAGGTNLLVHNAAPSARKMSLTLLKNVPGIFCPRPLSSARRVALPSCALTSNSDMVRGQAAR